MNSLGNTDEELNEIELCTETEEKASSSLGLEPPSMSIESCLSSKRPALKPQPLLELQGMRGVCSVVAAI